MHYKLQPSPHGTGMILLTFEPEISTPELERASLLARGLKGRYAPAFAGFNLRPAYARKWEILFKSGFTAIRVQGRFGGPDCWKFQSPRGHQMVPRKAVKWALGQEEDAA